MTYDPCCGSGGLLINSEAKRLDAELKSIFTGLGHRWAGDQ